MSAALQLATVWAMSVEPAQRPAAKPAARKAIKAEEPVPPISLAFYRKHTESMLRRYLYASMQVGRAPSILSDPVSRGWPSSRKVQTFEDAVIFVLDVERCLERLSPLDKQMLSRVVLQEYTQAEAASMLHECKSHVVQIPASRRSADRKTTGCGPSRPTVFIVHLINLNRTMNVGAGGRPRSTRSTFQSHRLGQFFPISLTSRFLERTPASKKQECLR
jgi:hypothetical protein